MAIQDRMTQEERKEYDRLRAQGYALLREAHAMFMTAHARTPHPPQTGKER